MEARRGWMSVVQALVGVLLLAGWCQSTPCSNPDSVSFNENNCLDALRGAAEDESKFWFGDKYAAKCAKSSKFNAECYNPFSGYTDSLATRLFRRTTFNKDKINTYLKVVYKTHTGSYEACGNTYTVSKSRTVSVDPLDEGLELTPFELVYRPMISWGDKTNNNGQPATSFYTLAILDAGYVIINALYVNIPDNDLDQGQAIVTYKPPDNPTSNPNPYVFLLFDQGNSFEVTPLWLRKLSLRDGEQFEQFITEMNLDGPVGISWLTVSGDPYSSSGNRSPFNVNNCVHFVSQAFKEKQIAFLPQNHNRDLSVYIDVTFKSKSIKYSSCCQTYSYPETIFKPNPIADGKANAAWMRNDTTRHITFHKATAFPQRSRDFKNEFHTLVLMDPDVPSNLAHVGSSSKPYNHMVVVNIRDGDFHTGEALTPYDGPWPPNYDHHTYYFMLFQQQYELHPQLGKYANPVCSGISLNRCAFDMAALVQDVNLELVGATWQLVKKSDYVRYKQVDVGNLESSVCADVEGYKLSCGNHGNTRDIML